MPLSFLKVLSGEFSAVSLPFVGAGRFFRRGSPSIHFYARGGMDHASARAKNAPVFAQYGHMGTAQPRREKAYTGKAHTAARGLPAK